VLLRAFVTDAESTADRSDADIADQALGELRRLLAVTGEPAWSMVARHMNASPQPRVGHADRVARMGEKIRTIAGLSVIGNAYDGIGIRDCARLASDAATRILSRQA
jgi:oxygen-dependent protoporphyrinogen oxidase